MGVAATSRPRALRLGVAGEVARWFETAIAFACLCLCGFETVVAFAGEKWAFFGAFFGRRGVVGFSGPVLGVSSGVVGFIVAMFLRPVRDICRPARPDVGASAKEFTLCRSWMQRGARGWLRWGFCSIRSWLSACRRRVVVLMTPFPPFGGGEAATWGGVLAKLQTHWAKTPKIGHFEEMGLHFGGFRYQAWCACSQVSP